MPRVRSEERGKPERGQWLSRVAAALGVTVTSCHPHQGPARAVEVPSPEVTPVNTSCMASVTPPAFVLGVGGDAAGICFGQLTCSPPMSSANCGQRSREVAPCSSAKPPKANVRAVVHASLPRPVLEGPLVAALTKVLSCAKGQAVARIRLVVNDRGMAEPSVVSATGWLKEGQCWLGAFAVTLPSGPDDITVDLTST